MRVRVGQRQLGFAAVIAAGAALIAGLCYALSPDVRVGWVGVLARAGADDRLAGLALDSDKDVRAAAAAALVGRGDRAVPALVGRLARPDPADRATACQVLGEIGPPARDTLPALEDLTRDDPDPGVRGQAILAFARVGRDDPRVVPELVRMLAAPAADDREAAAFPCRMLGAEAKGAIPALIDALADPDPEVREEAVKALTAVAGGLGDGDAALRDQGRAAAAKALAGLQAAGPPGGP